MNALTGLMNPAAIGQQVQQSFQAGQQMRGQLETRNALSTLSTDPANEDAMRNLTFYNPQLGMQVQSQNEQRAAREQEAQANRLAGLAAQGNSQALAALWGVDWETAQKLSDTQAEGVTKAYEAMGQIALGVDQLPPEQRPAAWDAGIDQLAGMGFDGLAQYRGQYSEQALQGIVAKAGEMQTLIGNRRPSYMAIPEGGTLVDTRNPQAVSQFGQQAQPAPGAPTGEVMNFEAYQGLLQLGPERAARSVQRLIEGGVVFSVSSPDQARQLPSGTPILLPDGTRGVVP